MAPNSSSNVLQEEQIKSTKIATSSLSSGSFFDKIGRQGANRLKLEVIDDAENKLASDLFDKSRALTEQYHACKNKTQRGKSNYAFSFLRCAVEDNEVLSEIWKYYGDGINYKDFAIPQMYSDSKCQVLLDGGKCTSFTQIFYTGIQPIDYAFISSYRHIYFSKWPHCIKEIDEAASKNGIKILWKQSPFMHLYNFPQYLQFAFTMCAESGGFLPTFAPKDEFEALFHAFRGNDTEIILWDEVDKVGDELFWCRGGAKLPQQPAVNGTTDKPFFLVSLAGPTPNLNAIQLNRTDVNTTIVYCLHSIEYDDECSSGKRGNVSSSLEELLNQHG